MRLTDVKGSQEISRAWSRDVDEQTAISYYLIRVQHIL
jgi:hypothetical protein